MALNERLCVQWDVQYRTSKNPIDFFLSQTHMRDEACNSDWLLQSCFETLKVLENI